MGKKFLETKVISGISLDKFVKDGIFRLAKKESRNFSNMANLILRNFLESKEVKAKE